MAARDEHQRTVVREYFVQKHRDVHRARFRHAIVLMPGGKVLMPLPDLAGEGCLGIDLELMNVDRFAEQLLERADQARVARQNAARFVVSMAGERGARYTALLSPDLCALFVEYL